MRKLVVTENVTINGVIDSSGGWFAPGDDTADLAAVSAVLQEQSAASDALLLGRTSFEEMRAFWPEQANDTTGIATHLDQVQKFVVSSTRSVSSTSAAYSPIRRWSAMVDDCFKTRTMCLSWSCEMFSGSVPQSSSRPMA